MMRFNLVFLIFLLLKPTAHAQVLPEYSGSWFNPDQAGHGINIEVIDAQRSIGFWYTYTQTGASQWFLFDGANVDDRIEAIVYAFDGMLWGDWDPNMRARQELGKLTIEFGGCNESHLTYSLGALGEGEISLLHLTEIADLECVTLGRLQGDWYAPLTPLEQAVSAVWNTTVAEDGSWAVPMLNQLVLSGQLMVDDEAGVITTTYTSNDPDAETFVYEVDYKTGYTLCATRDVRWWHGCKVFDEVLIYTDSEQGNEVVMFARDRERQKLELFHLMGEWMVEVQGFGPFDTVVMANGSFEFYDSMSCLWSGQISIPEEDPLTLTLDNCRPDSGPFDLYGVYVEPFNLCSSGGACVTYPAAMGFEGYQGPDKYQVTLVRPLPGT
jgi:hypothetical protein